ncbi:homoserine O-acetyltransferase [bacterium]|nr:homoserine O-acetyltransferase [bacterium]
MRFVEEADEEKRQIPLREYELAYTTYGKLNADKSNVVWVIHPLTANAQVHEWWPQLFGSGKLLNPDKYYIICANNLGSPYGSTAPLSINPATGEPYYYHFPQLTIRQLVVSYQRLQKQLDLPKIHLLIGASMGGMQALQWAANAPDSIENLVLIATNAVHSAFGKGFNAAQRMAIETDASWGLKHEDAAQEGLKAARAIAMLSYRGYQAFEKQHDIYGIKGITRAEAYLRYQGLKFNMRFNALSYWHLTKIMDSHSLTAYKLPATRAMKKISANTLVVGIHSDLLFPPSEQDFIHEHIPNSTLRVLHSEYGHDGFLVEPKLNEIIMNWYHGKKTTYVNLNLLCRKIVWS